MKPAAGKLFRAVGKVVRAGRTLIVCNAEVHAQQQERKTIIAVMQATIISVRERDGVTD
jgi:acyl-coenzyme A thioesterase PaaI-like protein